MQLDPCTEFRTVRVWPDSSGILTAYTIGSQRSGFADSLGGADALIALPSTDEAKASELLVGEIADAILIDF